MSRDCPTVNVNFRIFIRDNRGIFPRYQRKFSCLMKEVSERGSKLSEYDYDDLPLLRKALSNATSIQDIPEIFEVIPPGDVSKLLNASPIFEIAPIDLKAHILMSLGVRSYHIKKSMKAATA